VSSASFDANFGEVLLGLPYFSLLVGSGSLSLGLSANPSMQAARAALRGAGCANVSDRPPGPFKSKAQGRYETQGE